MQCEDKMTAERLTNFDHLPNSALISSKELVALTGRSRTSLWRDVVHGFLPKPIKIGNASSRWTVEQVKEYLTGNNGI